VLGPAGRGRRRGLSGFGVHGRPTRRADAVRVGRGGPGPARGQDQ
jgi:hypothetical protein